MISTKMTTRDEFPDKTRRALAERAAHHCSFPGCSAITIGPSDESKVSVSKTGMACHIAAAAGGLGARRYVPNMTKGQRTSIKNGVWMCYKHGKLVDTDEKRFTIPMLRKWRELAEFRAQWMQDHGAERPVPLHVLEGRVGLADEELRFVKLGNENAVLGTAFMDCCVESIWSQEISRVVRDVAVEIIRNSLTHGKASECIVQITRDAIFVRDNGFDFSVFDLEMHPKGRGGAAATKHLIAKCGQEVILGSKRQNGMNETMFARGGSYSGILLTKPCCIQLDRHDFEQIKTKQFPARLLSPELNPCKLVYLLLPSFLTPSDTYILRESISQDAVCGKKIIFVAPGSSSFVCQQIAEFFPNCRVLQI
jgi:hypothetical protein